MGRGRERTSAEFLWGIQVIFFRTLLNNVAGGWDILKWDADESGRARVLLGNPCDIFTVILEYFSAMIWFGAEVKE